MQAPLAIHTNHSLTPLLICPHAHTCACVHIRIYSPSPLHLYIYTYTSMLYSLTHVTLNYPYILYGNTLWHARGKMPCTLIPHALIMFDRNSISLFYDRIPRSECLTVKDVVRKQVEDRNQKERNAGLMEAWSHAQYAGETEREKHRNLYYKKCSNSMLFNVHMCVYILLIRICRFFTITDVHASALTAYNPT